MATGAKSRWADDEEDVASEAQRKHEKEEKKRAKAEEQRKLEAAEAARQQSIPTTTINGPDTSNEVDGRPSKRRRLSPEPSNGDDAPTKLLRFPAPEWSPCRHVDNFEKLNHIEEGSYGWVSRAKDIATGEVVALKKLKMENRNDGFPVTGLREIQTLMASKHTNIVKLREVVTGDRLDE
ncbi:MAG: hypothetical protein L6R40_000698 [Gallowayella cf. fulva]|nr:MAG: hypothetical protein L6R40_000698 [Xanthomendoza cf. fulva]